MQSLSPRNTSVPDWDKSPRVTGVQLRVEQALCREVVGRGLVAATPR